MSMDILNPLNNFDAYTIIIILQSLWFQYSFYGTFVISLYSILYFTCPHMASSCTVLPHWSPLISLNSLNYLFFQTGFIFFLMMYLKYKSFHFSISSTAFPFSLRNHLYPFPSFHTFFFHPFFSSASSWARSIHIIWFMIWRKHPYLVTGQANTFLCLIFVQMVTLWLLQIFFTVKLTPYGNLAYTYFEHSASSVIIEPIHCLLQLVLHWHRCFIIHLYFHLVLMFLTSNIYFIYQFMKFFHSVRPA